MKLTGRQKSIIGILFILTLITLLWLGLARIYPENMGLRYFPDKVYKIIKIVLGGDPAASTPERADTPWELIVAKIFVIIILVAGVFKIIQKVFYEQYTGLKIALRSGHDIVIGASRKGSSLLRSIKKCNGKTAIGIEADAANSNIRRLRKEGHLILIGDATEKDILLEAGIRRASNLICFLEEEQTTIAVAEKLHEVAAGQRQKSLLNCYLHFDNSRLLELVKKSDIYKCPVNKLLLHFFNIHKMVARNFFYQLAIDHQAQIRDEKVSFRLVIAGFGDYAKALLLQAFRVFHLQEKRSVEIIIYTRNKEVVKKVFLERYPKTEKILSVQFKHFSETFSEIVADNFRDNLPGICPVFIAAFDDDKLNIDLSLEVLYATLNQPFRIYTLNAGSKGINTLLSSADSHRRLNFFGSSEDFCKIELVTGQRQDHLAKAIHKDYLTLLSGAASESKSYTTGWNELSEDAKDANRAQADHILLKLLMTGKWQGLAEKNPLSFSESEVEQLAVAEHSRWMAHRYINGWDFGATRNDLLKLHPSMIPWESLPEAEKQKDRDTILRIGRIVKNAQDVSL